MQLLLLLLLEATVVLQMVQPKFLGLLDGDQFLPLLDLHLVNLPEEGVGLAPRLLLEAQVDLARPPSSSGHHLEYVGLRVGPAQSIPLLPPALRRRPAGGRPRRRPRRGAAAAAALKMLLLLELVVPLLLLRRRSAVPP